MDNQLSCKFCFPAQKSVRSTKAQSPNKLLHCVFPCKLYLFVQSMYNQWVSLWEAKRKQQHPELTNTLYRAVFQKACVCNFSTAFLCFSEEERSYQDEKFIEVYTRASLSFYRPNRQILIVHVHRKEQSRSRRQEIIDYLCSFTSLLQGVLPLMSTLSQDLDKNL